MGEEITTERNIRAYFPAFVGALLFVLKRNIWCCVRGLFLSLFCVCLAGCVVVLLLLSLGFLLGGGVCILRYYKGQSVCLNFATCAFKN